MQPSSYWKLKETKLAIEAASPIMPAIEVGKLILHSSSFNVFLFYLGVFVDCRFALHNFIKESRGGKLRIVTRQTSSLTPLCCVL